MVRVLCIVPLALAAVSAVSGHVIRGHKKPPNGWETSILQVYSLLVWAESCFSSSLAELRCIPRTVLTFAMPEAAQHHVF